MSEFTLTGGINIDLGVSDLTRSKEWYRDVLGFEVIFEETEHGYIFLGTRSEMVTIGLGQVESPQVQGGATPTWNCTGIEAGRAEMEAKGVRFDGPIRDLGTVKLVTFYDPDGYPWMLAESAPPPAG